MKFSIEDIEKFLEEEVEEVRREAEEGSKTYREILGIYDLYRKYTTARFVKRRLNLAVYHYAKMRGKIKR